MRSLVFSSLYMDPNRNKAGVSERRLHAQPWNLWSGRAADRDDRGPRQAVCLMSLCMCYLKNACGARACYIQMSDWCRQTRLNFSRKQKAAEGFTKLQAHSEGLNYK